MACAGVALETQVPAAAAEGDGDGEQAGDPGPALPEVDGVEAQQGDGEGDEAGDGDTDVDADAVRVQRRERLAAGDGREDREARQGGRVEEERDRDQVEACGVRRGSRARWGIRITHPNE